MTRKTVADAMARADQAVNRIETHEEVCAQRYENIAAGQRALQKSHDTFKDDVTKALQRQDDKNDRMLWWVIATLLTALAGTISMLFVLVTHAH